MSQAAQTELGATHNHTQQPAVFDLQALLGSRSVEAFLQEEYGRTWVHVPGYPGKFAALLPWDALNEILEEHRLEPPMLRLTREGKPVPPERYLSYQTNRRKGARPIPRLNAAKLTAELREGSTLVLDNVDELHRPVRKMAEALERVFRVRVQVNSYSGWGTSHGFDLHWDDHDVFILQIAGRKHWKVYGMTRRFPLGADVERADTPPEDVLWEGLLEDGDLLYIPRGWWHVATPLNEPTLHLTVGVNNPTGADFLTWFAQKLRAEQTVREDVPHLAGPDAMAAYAERLRRSVMEAWSPNLVEQYMATLDTTSRARPSFALPWAATEDVLPAGEFRVRWSVARKSSIETNSAGELVVTALGRNWRFAPAARPILDALTSGREYTSTEVTSVGKDAGLQVEVVRAFLRELAVNGLVVTIQARG